MPAQKTLTALFEKGLDDTIFSVPKRLKKYHWQPFVVIANESLAMNEKNSFVPKVHKLIGRRLVLL